MEFMRTPLYENHVNLKAKMVDFAGWLMPIQYEGLKKEHFAVRENVGMFDVCHMGEILLTGTDAHVFLNSLLTNDLDALPQGKALYTFLCQEDAGVVDDLLVYKYSHDKYLLVVNASNTQKVLKWILDHKKERDVIIEDLSEETALLAVQGPGAVEVVSSMTQAPVRELEAFEFIEDVEIEGIKAMVSRTGYTGEDGFEIYVSSKEVVKLWEIFLEKGVTPCGLGARDTLRFEAGLPLYGHEISEDINPLEAGFGFFVKLHKKDDFVGKEALEKIKESGPRRKVVGLQLMGKGIPREGYSVVKDEKVIGVITTGYLSPTLEIPIANALVDAQFSELETEVEVLIRDKKIPAVIRSKRFLQDRK